ncbi:MAG: hypothetical protein FWF66_00090 [Candidatus Bathyarchaeota archaeon]|nr:hypothetical protein [Candidatus Termiticorpusculum sp.]
MNTKILAILLVVCITVITCVVYITALGNNRETNNIIENPLEGIVLEIKESTLTSTGITLMIKNRASNDYGYGSYYQVEKKVDNNWEPLPHILQDDTNVGWTSELRILKGNNTNEEKINWTWNYGILGPGNYRVTKNFAYLTTSGIIGEYYPISAEFTIALTLM